MFDNLPLEIREIIFSRVRYIDLFETVRVSQGWWTLTMASFQKFHYKKDDFLLDQVDFCNQIMPKEEPWEWWMLMEFTKSKRLYLEISDFHALVSDGEGRLIQYFSSKQIHVKHLRVDKSESNDEVLRLPPNLDKIFPCLESLEADCVVQDDDSTIVFPLHLTSLRFGLKGIPSTGSIALKTRELTELDLKECGFLSFYLLDALQFDNLTRLSVSADGLIDMATQFSSAEIERILKKVLHENKTIKSVSFDYAYITKEWLKILPANVAEIELFEPRLNQDLVKAFGMNVFYERFLLLYVCEDWTSVVKFKTLSMSWEKYQEDNVDDEEQVDNEEEVDKKEVDDDEERNEGDNDIENTYQVDYTCKPTANKETIFVKYSKVAINKWISENNEGLLLAKLMYYHNSFSVPIPPNVQYLSILEEVNVIDDDYEKDYKLVLEDPTALQTLIGRVMYYKDWTVTLPKLINLKVLYIRDCEVEVLVSALRSCTSLSKLTLCWPNTAVFGSISPKIKSVSLKSLTIIDGSDTFEDILEHFPFLNSLTLEGYRTEPILKSDVNAIESLQYFKLCTYGNKEMAVHFSSLQFPYMLFVVSSRSHSYTASKGLELVNELSRQVSKNNIAKATLSSLLYVSSVPDKAVSLVYARNIATRFLENSSHLVNTVQDFIAKLQAAEYN